MTTKGKLPVILLLLPILQTVPSADAEDAPFTYSDDWSLVSAPPPPGPYQAVNIDPRVPGQDAIPPMTTGIESFHNWEQLPADIDANPPAAGKPALPPAGEPATRQGMPGNNAPAPVPGNYESRLQRPPDYHFAEPVRMPKQEPYPKYGNVPPSGYYSPPAVPVEEEVPPPPVYDAMTGQSSGVYGRSRGQ
jgi:hypothetical protein